MSKLLERYASGRWRSLSDDDLLRLEQEIEELMNNYEYVSEKLKQIAVKAHLTSLRLQLHRMKRVRDPLG